MDAPLPSDADLVSRANRGDAEAMEALYERYRGWVFGFALRLCRNESDAADVLQDVFAYFFQKFPGFELRSRLKTFLYPVVRNSALNHIRKYRRMPSLEGEADFLEETAAAPPGNAEGALHFSEIVARLPDEEREVVILRFEEERSLADISEALGIPLGTVKSRLHRALERLRQRLSPS
ncbi:MAG: sigma-70 family RNA polymerase sigma factor [Planctomycetota bacterium]